MADVLILSYAFFTRKKGKQTRSLSFSSSSISRNSSRSSFLGSKSKKSNQIKHISFQQPDQAHTLQDKVMWKREKMMMVMFWCSSSGTTRVGNCWLSLVLCKKVKNDRREKLGAWEKRKASEKTRAFIYDYKSSQVSRPARK